MKIRSFFLCLSILAALTTTGCWNRKELDTLSIVEAIGIDNADNNRVNITFQILNPGVIKEGGGDGAGTSGGGGKKGVSIVESSGETIFEAARNATFESDRKLFFSHNKVIIIGEETAKAGLAPLIDFLDRDHEAREGSRYFIARGKASDIIEGTHEQEKIPADAIENLARISFATSQIPQINLLDFLKTIASKTSAPYIPGIKVLDQGDERMKKLRLESTAILKNDKLIGWFNKKETRGLLWVEGKVKSGIIIVKSPEQGTKKVALEIIRASCLIEPQMATGNLTIRVNVKEEGNLGEQLSEQVNLTKPDLFKQLEMEQTAAIEAEINSALLKAREWGVDIFKFGEAVHRKYPAYWRNMASKWGDEFPGIKVNVQVDAKLRRYGQKTYPDRTED